MRDSGRKFPGQDVLVTDEAVVFFTAIIARLYRSLKTSCRVLFPTTSISNKSCFQQIIPLCLMSIANASHYVNTML